MKILNVRFKNISTFQGEFEVHFDRSPLADTGIFAIVGPNGSGKSSILDALTLALYGETPRLKNPESEIMNRHASDAYAEAAFSVGGTKYRTEWAIHRDNGQMVGPAMRLFNLDEGETLLEDRVGKVRNHVSELTGLDFKRFCRSILLAQGDFLAFLNALENERVEIMEKIVGTEMNRELEETVQAELEAGTARLLQLNEALGGFSLMEKGQLDGLRDALRLAESQLEETETALDALKRDEEWYERQDLVAASHREAAETLAQAEGRFTQLQADLNRVKRAEKALPLREDIKRHDALKEAADGAASSLQELEIDIQRDDERLLTLEGDLQESRRKLDSAREDLENQDEVLQAALIRDREIEAEEASYGGAVLRRSKLEEAQEEKLRELSDVELRLAEIQNFRQEIQGWFQRHEDDRSLGSEIPGLEGTVSRLKEIRQELDDFQTQERDALGEEQQVADDLGKAERRAMKALKGMEKASSRKAGHVERRDELLEGSSLDVLIEEFQVEKSRLVSFQNLLKISRDYRRNALGGDPSEALAKISTEQERLLGSLALEEDLLSDLEGESLWYQAKKNFLSERSLLKPGKPCPLCGALEHRLEELDSMDPDPRAASALQTHREQVKSLKGQIKALGDKAVGLRRRMSAMETASREWEGVCEKAGLECAITEEKDIVEGVQSCKVTLRRLRSRIRGVRWHAWWVQLADRRLQRKSEKCAQREKMRDELRDKHESEAKTLADIRDKLEFLRQGEREAQEDLAQRLGSLHEPMPEQGMEAELLDRLKERREYYSRQSRDSEALETQLPSLQERRQTLTHEIEQSKEREGGLAEEIRALSQRISTLKDERVKLFGELDPIGDRRTFENEISLRDAEQLSLDREMVSIREGLPQKQSLIPQAEGVAREAHLDLEDFERELMERLTPLGFHSLDEAKGDLHLLDTERNLDEQLAAAEVCLTEARSRLETAQSELELAPDRSLGTIHDGISETTKKKNHLQSKIQDIYYTLERQREIEGAYLETLEAIREQEKVCSRATDDLGMLQSGDLGQVMTRLRRFMLERLLQKANEHLELLSGRYSLRPLSEEGLGIKVLDALQGNAFRSLKTLSGGESFLASLCLALALSGMASRDRKIESLFLDEGFGALDDEMLYKVTAALKALRSNGKMVGIISHVKRLADEIPTQIRVEKLPDGSSTISVVA